MLIDRKSRLFVLAIEQQLNRHTRTHQERERERYLDYWSATKSNFFVFSSTVSFLLRRCAVRATGGIWIDLTFKPVQE